MKKLLFTLLLAAMVLPSWADYPEALFAIGTATTAGWTQYAGHKLHQTSDGHYEGFVNLTGVSGGRLKFLTQSNWGPLWGPETNEDVISKTGTNYNLAWDNGSNDFQFISSLSVGLYIVKIDLTTGEGHPKPTVSFEVAPNVYEIGNPNQLKIFANGVNTACTSIDAKLIADIGSSEGEKMDFAIGWHESDSKNKWYSGEFDGNNKTVYLGINKSGDDNQGLFGAITDGAYIHDVTVAGSVTGRNGVAGIVGTVRGTSGSVNISHCTNNATISGADDTGGIVGLHCNISDVYCTANILYCRNTGNVSGSYNKAALICAWMGKGSIKHTFASGSVTNNESNREFSKYSDNVTFDANATMTGSESTEGASYFDASSGTYTVSDAEKFRAIATMVNIGGQVSKNFTLGGDIDMTDKTFTPIGTAEYKYAGTFDGGGHSITQLKIKSSEAHLGLFSYCAGATIQNLVIDANCSFESDNTSAWGNAAFVARCEEGTLTFVNCGNEATVSGGLGNNAAFLGAKHDSGLVSFTNCYNTGNISGGSYNAAFIGDNAGNSYTTKNCYNSGTISRGDEAIDIWVHSAGETCTITNCYNTTDIGLTGLTPVNTTQVASGELCAKLGYGFRQDADDPHPNFNDTHAFVNKISGAGYTTQYNTVSAVTIPSGVTAYAGEINGNRDKLILHSITETIAKGEPVILKGTANTIYRFAPAEDVDNYASNALSGSDGTATGGDKIYALAIKSGVVGFYPVGSGVKIPEGRAYLTDISGGGGGVKGFTFVFEDDPDGIKTLSDSPVKGENIYNLAGQRISKMQKGINIVNGKKIMK